MSTSGKGGKAAKNTKGTKAAKAAKAKGGKARKPAPKKAPVSATTPMVDQPSMF